MPATAQRELTGVQKAAVLLLQLGKERASKVLATMHEAEVEEIAGEIVKMGSLPSSISDSVLAEFHSMIVNGAGNAARGGVDAARDMLEGSLGRLKTEDMLERVSHSPGRIPFAFLRDADPRQLLNILGNEHPQTIALVLAHLRAEQASRILSGLGEALQGDVAVRIATMDRTSPEMIRAVAEVLHRRTSSVLSPVDTSEVGGLKPLVEIINRADPGSEKTILEGIEGRDAGLAEQVRSKMFVFDDILGLEDRAVQLVLRQVESNVLATALKGTKPEVSEKVLRNVSERARENLTEEIELLGRVRVSEVEEARSGIVAQIRALESAGEIVLRRGGEEEEEYVA